MQLSAWQKLHSTVLSVLLEILYPSCDVEQVFLAVERVIVRACSGGEWTVDRLVVVELIFEDTLTTG